MCRLFRVSHHPPRPSPPLHQQIASAQQQLPQSFIAIINAYDLFCKYSPANPTPSVRLLQVSIFTVLLIRCMAGETSSHQRCMNPLERLRVTKGVHSQDTHWSCSLGSFQACYVISVESLFPLARYHTIEFHINHLRSPLLVIATLSRWPRSSSSGGPVHVLQVSTIP